jgi:hypothetical protein
MYNKDKLRIKNKSKGELKMEIVDYKRNSLKGAIIIDVENKSYIAVTAAS